MIPVVICQEPGWAARYLAGVETGPGMRCFLPLLTFDELAALRDKITEFLAEEEKEETVDASQA